MAPICAAQSAPPVSDDERRAAHDAYEKGKAAFEAQDYLRAGKLFLEAYERAPHHDPLWNAARAFELGGESARAANLYSRYLDEAPPDARDRDRATAARTALAGKLGRIDLQLRGVTDAAIDGVTTTATSTFVDPGTHLLSARAGTANVRIVQSVLAGAAVSVVLEPPPPEIAVSPPPASKGTRVLSPWVVGGELLITAGFGAISIWSGVDTVTTKHDYNATPNADLYAAGQSKESRTNALFWTTAGLGVVTAATAIFFVDWRGSHESVRAQVGAGSAQISGTF
jgi:hypothetical protein